MGSTGSKAFSNESTTSAAANRRRTRSSRTNWGFRSPCLGLPSGSRCDNRDINNNNNQRKNENEMGQTETESDELEIDCDRKVKDDIPSNGELDGWNQASITSTTGSSSARSSSNPSRFLSRFSFIPGNLSFRLSRATSLGSSRAYPASSTNLSVLNDEQDLSIVPSSGPSTRNFIDRIEIESQQDRDIDGTRVVGVDGNVDSPITLNELENVGTRYSDRRIGAREPVERNVRFSRTLSVGRLRDRVLRRSSLSDFTFCPLQQEREAMDANQGSGRHAFGHDTRMPTSEGNDATSPTTSGYPSSGMSSSLFNIQDPEVETSRAREARYHDLLEHRSNFLERRRRIRSQVRALQRLGSRFENLSGHERSCILSGQHRMGRCTCRVTNRDANSNDETGTRASISRIVMLAEALFEVLDEIHQQSVVLSSRPSVSALGSIPAPNEVVESLPVKLYTKSQKNQNEEAAQCYICLVEYEEDDSVRILPCHHEFHRTCVDKWLKEVHRVCPLCRGDICKSDTLPSEN
ncbi:hypothetical protein LWI29_033193 [Acer saccharum]|uniref:RING-type domain-containing protein n=1 Tax=Acer saccharum TaxID=4024 RepID=A0AA39SIN9_ACESA|nr:hypothetical protein LWI29_033193 [Acer saccharum]KAK1568163.1 hypothetical protein Q3G72_021309 [Acer saccharum]